MDGEFIRRHKIFLIGDKYNCTSNTLQTLSKGIFGSPPMLDLPNNGAPESLRLLFDWPQKVG
jgi:hypothetical protein